MSNEAKTCPRCGSHIPENAPGGLCPKCLLAGAAATTGAGATPDKRLAPPSIHSLAAAREGWGLFIAPVNQSSIATWR